MINDFTPTTECGSHSFHSEMSPGMKKPLTLCEQSEAGRLGVGIELSIKSFRGDCRSLQLPSIDDGEPSRCMDGEVVIFTVNGVK